MKSVLTRTVFVFAVVLMLAATTSAEQLKGSIGSAAGPSWQSSWIDLTIMTNFRRGEELKITVHGSAENVVVRFLPQGTHPSSSEGIVGDIMKVPKDGVLKVKLKENRRNVVQISIHGGQKAWNISLGSNNGPVTLTSVERFFQ